MKNYHNTTKQKGKRLKEYEMKAATQDQKVASFFESQPGELFNPWEIRKLAFEDPRPPITSIRRSMSNLTHAHILEKTKIMEISGPYKRPTYKWQLNESYRESLQALDMTMGGISYGEIVEKIIPEQLMDKLEETIKNNPEDPEEVPKLKDQGSGALEDALRRSSKNKPENDPQGKLFEDNLPANMTPVDCKICGKQLTNPLSIARGIGPVCAGGVHNIEIREKTKNKPIMMAPVVVMAWRDTNGKPLSNIDQVIVDHSLDGFNWGYGGSGPADFALNILYAFTGDKTFSYAFHQDFKWEFISKLPFQGGEISGLAIFKWIQDRKEAQDENNN